MIPLQAASFRFFGYFPSVDRDNKNNRTFRNNLKLLLGITVMVFSCYSILINLAEFLFKTLRQRKEWSIKDNAIFNLSLTPYIFETAGMTANLVILLCKRRKWVQTMCEIGDLLSALPSHLRSKIQRRCMVISYVAGVMCCVVYVAWTWNVWYSTYFDLDVGKKPRWDDALYPLPFVIPIWVHIFVSETSESLSFYFLIQSHVVIIIFALILLWVTSALNQLIQVMVDRVKHIVDVTQIDLKPEKFVNTNIKDESKVTGLLEDLAVIKDLHKRTVLAFSRTNDYFSEMLFAIYVSHLATMLAFLAAVVVGAERTLSASSLNIWSALLFGLWTTFCFMPLASFHETVS